MTPENRCACAAGLSLTLVHPAGMLTWFWSMKCCSGPVPYLVCGICAVLAPSEVTSISRLFICCQIQSLTFFLFLVDFFYCWPSIHMVRKVNLVLLLLWIFALLCLFGFIIKTSIPLNYFLHVELEVSTFTPHEEVQGLKIPWFKIIFRMFYPGGDLLFPGNDLHYLYNL